MAEARDVLMLSELWDNTDSDTISENVTRLLKNNGLETLNERMDVLCRVTNSSKHAVYAWLNHGRTNVKVPFLKLCAIADAYGVEVSGLLIGGNYKMERKFAVTRIIGNDEKVLKSFPEDQKQEAIEYGAEVAKTNTEGVITCILAMFNDEGKMGTHNVMVYKVW